MNVGHSHPRVVEAIREQAERFTHTDFTVIPYENYVGLAERLLELAPISGETRAALLQLGRRGDRELDQVRARLHEAAGGDRLRGRLPRAHAARAQPHVEDAPVQGGPRPVRAGDLPRSRSTTSTRSSTPSRRAWPPRTWRRSSSSRCRARGLRRALRRSSCRASGGSATSTASSWWRTRCRPASAARAGRSPIEHFGIEPDLIAVAKSIAAGLPLSGVLGRAEIMDAPGDSAVGGTYVGNPVAIAAAARRARRDRRGGAQRARRGDRRDDPRPDGELARPLRRGRGGARARGDAGDRPRAGREARTPTSPPPSPRARRRGLLLLKAGIYSNCIRVLVPLVIEDAELAEALDVWEEALTEALG